MVATFEEVNKAYNAFRDRYYTVQARGAGRKYPTEMDLIRTKLTSIERAWPTYTNSGNPDRLLDIVVNEGLKIQKMLDQIESDFPAGTLVKPGSTGEGNRLLSSDIRVIPPEQLEAEAPFDVGQDKFDDVFKTNQSGWYVAGIDMRWVAGAVLGLVAINYFWRRR